MAFGLLGSIIPQINRNEILYLSPVDTLTIGKVSISSKNYNPVKIRLGITSDDINVEYLEYNRIINYGETFQTDSIYLGNGQKLIVRSSDPDVNFLLYGETVDETGNFLKSGLLSSIVSTGTQKNTLYSVPSNFKVLLTLSICNLGSTPSKVRIALTESVVDSSDYLEYDAEIYPNQTYTRTDIKLNENQKVICSSSENSNINFVCHGKFIYDELVGDINLNVPGNAIINGTLGVGIVNAREKLDVVGNALISGNLNVSGQIIGTLNNSTLNQSLINLNALPAIDGSALSGIVATGSGVEIRDSGVPVGTASTLSFTDNISVSFSTGIAQIKVSDDINVNNNFSINTNKLIVDGLNGNTQIAGRLSVNSDIVSSGNIDTLNNKVVNVGTATSAFDATNKKYVDSRSIAMSIALS